MKKSYQNEIVTVVAETFKKYLIEFWDGCQAWVDKDLCNVFNDDDIPF